MSPVVIFLNGPPRSGKDTLAAHLSHAIRLGTHLKFSLVLKHMTHGLYGHAKPHDAYESTKDQPSDDFLGLTPRQAYIGVSELLVKPQHGVDAFGRILLKTMVAMDGCRAHIISDSGFAAEAMPIVEHFGAARCLLIRLHRPGCTFDGDSRSLIELPGVETVDLGNNGTEADLCALGEGIARAAFSDLWGQG